MNLLTWQDLELSPVVTKYILKSGQILYRPRNKTAIKLLYKIDDILAGFNESQITNKFTVVNCDDEVIIYSNKSKQFWNAQGKNAK
tara:strand:+ start:699 stop:956 length:258 start_codon:yes stop_codon:yes gene_type:complete